jgi:flavin-dependent dehydrogenase
MGPGADCVVVIGAGPAGAAAASILALKGRAVILVDGGGSVDRIEMLPPAGIAAFAAAGLNRLLNDTAIASPCFGIIRGPEREDFIGRPGGRGVR